MITFGIQYSLSQLADVIEFAHNASDLGSVIAEGAYQPVGTNGLRAGDWKTRSFVNYKTKVRNASPYIYGYDFIAGVGTCSARWQEVTVYSCAARLFVLSVVVVHVDSGKIPFAGRFDVQYQIIDNHVVTEFVNTVSNQPQKLWHTVAIGFIFGVGDRQIVHHCCISHQCIP
jgi:hypothetical protein